MLSALALVAALGPATLDARLGVCLHLIDSTTAEFPAVRKTGFGAVRTDLPWNEIERQPGQYEWTKFDNAVRALRASNLRPLLILMGPIPRFMPDESPRTPEAVSAFAKFAGLAAERYGTTVDYEIWNEPNSKGFWKPAPNAREYVALAKATSKAIRAVEPRARIIGLSATWPLWPFLQECLSLGLVDSVDALSIHPYRPQRPESVAGDVARIRQMLSPYAGGRNIGIEITEMGYPITFPGQDEARRARYLTRSFLTSLVAGVDRFYVYQWRDKRYPGESQSGYGLNDESLLPLPARSAFANLATGLSGYAYVRRLPSSPDDYVLLFTRDSAKRYVVWSARRDPADAETAYRSPGLAPQVQTPTVNIEGKAVLLSGTPRVVAG